MKTPYFLLALALCACSESTEPVMDNNTAPEVQEAIDGAEVKTQAEADASAKESITEDNMDAVMDDLEKEIMSDN